MSAPMVKTVRKISRLYDCYKTLQKRALLRASSSSTASIQTATRATINHHENKHRPKCYGQPAPHTHPHILSVSEVTPGITKMEFRIRRERLVELIQKSPISRTQGHHLIIIPSSQKYFMSVDVPYTFRQNTDFLYLTGFKEADSVLILKANGSSHFDEVLFVTQLDKNSELWEGPCAGVDGAKDLLGIENVYSLSELQGYLAKYLRDNRDFVIWYDSLKPVNAKMHEMALKVLVDEGRHALLERPTPLIHSLRQHKSQAEIELMRRTCRIAADAMTRTIEFSVPGIEEGHLYAKMDYECRINGADYLAYPPVIAGGNRACTIHYILNNQRINGGELVLMDAGCEYYGYCSDITRTWPVSGEFTPAQRLLYQVVLETQLACLSACRPMVTLDHLYMLMLRLLALNLQRIGLLSKDLLEQDAMRLARQFCPHHLGHWLGMDVHDCSQVIKSQQLTPNMVITVEPGLYIPEDRLDVPAEYRGIGIRIEDDVLITENGCENLTEACPKFSHQIESLIRSP